MIMDKNIKIVAFHLPQFHAIPENDKWWGEGFTEWTNVKRAKKYYEGQNQPRVPMNDNYYNLMDPEVLKWQAKLANDFGIYGFCFYHYWFNGHMLLQKPVELFKNLKREEKCHYCICWANEDWTRAWSEKRNEILIRQKYGSKEEWKEHFEYLLQFFKDEKYMLDEGKPILVIYRPELIHNLKEMLECWNDMAIENGFKGMCYIYQQYSYLLNHGEEEKMFRYNIEYQPSYALNQLYSEYAASRKIEKIYCKMPIFVQTLASKIKSFITNKKIYKVYDYDEIWHQILESNPSTKKAIPGAFVDFDNSPRRQEKCTYFSGMSLEKFSNYMKLQVENSKKKYHSPYIFIFAWNEWGESGYLEPDSLNGFGYLRAVRDAVYGED